MSYDNSVPMGTASQQPLILDQINGLGGRTDRLAGNLKVLEERLAKVCHSSVPMDNKAEVRKAMDVGLANELQTIMDRVDNMIGVTDSILARLEI